MPTPGRLVLSLVVLAGSAAAGLAQPVEAAPPTAPAQTPPPAPPPESADGRMASLIGSKPVLFKKALRYRRFYGDADTTHGDLHDRGYLTDDWGGVRDDLLDRGLYTYFGTTQFFEGNVGGGLARVARANGSHDYSFWLDTGKTGLWPDGAIFLHGETGWALNKNADVGSLVPSNYDAVKPSKDLPATALSEAYYLQAVTPRLVVGIGKVDLAAYADLNLFANNWRYQFSYAGLVNNPQLGAFVPYTTWANWWAFFPAPDTQIGFAVNTQEGTATAADFDKIFNGNMTYGMFVSHSPTVAGRPGLYQVLVGYSTNEPTSFVIDPAYTLAKVVGDIPIPRQEGNYGVVGSFSQYVWMAEPAAGRGGRKPTSPPGVGVFGRFGLAPGDRNVIERFLSAGVGGFGGPFGRVYDNWGVGWASSRLSADLRRAVGPLLPLRSKEQAVEAFYNFGLTPWAYLTVNTQVIVPAERNLDTAVALGTRLQVDY